MPIFKSRAASRLLLATALVLAIAAWLLAVLAAPLTGPHTMRWHRADGTALAPASDDRLDAFQGCLLADANLDLAVWRGGVLLPCRDEALGTGWAFLDPATQQAALRWPLADPGEALLTQGLLPGPGQQLAIVFQQAFKGDVLVGVAGPQGWQRAPESLGPVRYLAGAWIGDRLELVTAPLSAEAGQGASAAVKVIAFEGGGRHERVAVAACANPCEFPPLVYRRGTRWIFEQAGHAVAEGGEPVAPAFAGRRPDAADIDQVAQGRLQTPAALALGHAGTPVIDAGGKPSQAASAPWDGMRTVRQNRFVIDNGVARRTPQWGDASLRAITERVGTRTLSWITDDADRLRITDAPQPTPDATAALPAVARLPQGLATRVFVPDGAGGFWLVDAAGESIHIDSALHRTDSLPLRDHLRAVRGVSALCAMGWALFGLPLLLLLCMGLWRVAATRGKTLAPSAARPVAIAAIAYLVSGGWALLWLLPALK